MYGSRDRFPAQSSASGCLATYKGATRPFVHPQAGYLRAHLRIDSNGSFEIAPPTWLCAPPYPVCTLHQSRQFLFIIYRREEKKNIAIIETQPCLHNTATFRRSFTQQFHYQVLLLAISSRDATCPSSRLLRSRRAHSYSFFGVCNLYHFGLRLNFQIVASRRFMIHQKPPIRIPNTFSMSKVTSQTLSCRPLCRSFTPPRPLKFTGNKDRHMPTMFRTRDDGHHRLDVVSGPALAR